MLIQAVHTNVILLCYVYILSAESSGRSVIKYMWSDYNSIFTGHSYRVERKPSFCSRLTEARLPATEVTHDSFLMLLTFILGV